MMVIRAVSEGHAVWSRVMPECKIRLACTAPSHMALRHRYQDIGKNMPSQGERCAYR